MSQMPLRRGVHPQLEEAANALIKQSLAGTTRHADKSDILTPWKADERRRREVMVPSGTPDPAVRSGIFTRAINPTAGHLNSRMGSVRGKRISQVFSGTDGDHSASGDSPGAHWDDE
jgi:hypothetical protein